MLNLCPFDDVRRYIQTPLEAVNDLDHSSQIVTIRNFHSMELNDLQFGQLGH